MLLLLTLLLLLPLVLQIPLSPYWGCCCTAILLTAIAVAVAVTGDFLRAGAHYRRLLQLLSAVASGEATSAVEAVLSAATKIVGIRQYDGLPDVFAAVPLLQQQDSKKQQQQQGRGVNLHLQQKQEQQCDKGDIFQHGRSPRQSGPGASLPIDDELRDPGGPRVPRDADQGGHRMGEGERQLEELMLCTLDALESQGLKASKPFVPTSGNVTGSVDFSSQTHESYYAKLCRSCLRSCLRSLIVCVLTLQRLRAHVCSQLLRLYMQLGEWTKV